MVAAVVERGNVDVATLADEFGVSAATVRRDLETLENQQLLSRTHGGATAHASFKDLPLKYKSGQDFEEKARIADCGAQFFDDATVIGLTGGTTVTELARRLVGRADKTIVTNALNIATELAANTGLRVFSAGGEVRPSSLEAVGPSAEAFFLEYNVDVAFLGVDGVDAESGCTNYDPIGARTNSALRRQSRMCIVLADASKISRVTLAPVCSISEVDVLITDSRAPEAAIEAIRQRGCRVMVV